MVEGWVVRQAGYCMGFESINSTCRGVADSGTNGCPKNHCWQVNKYGDAVGHATDSLRRVSDASQALLPSFVFTVLLLVVTPQPSDAVIYVDGDGSDNTTAPVDDPGWDNVGVHGVATAVYLGNRWAITADHLSTVETITFNGLAMPVETESEIALTNPDDRDLSPFTDLRLVRLMDEPELPVLTISATTPPIDSEVVMIGRGRERESELTLWNVTVFGDEVTWTETEFPPGEQAGYKWLSTQTMRWGVNTIVDDLEFNADENDLDHNVIADIDGVDVISIVTRLDEEDALEFEGHATLGDSGGGVFYKNDGQWELAAIMFAVGVSGGQPERTAVFGNFTVSADLSFYREQIQAVLAGPELAAGDANQDLSFDQFDLVQVAQANRYRTGEPATWGEGDWNGPPGGTSGDPSVGDGVFDQFDIVASQQNGFYLTGPYAAVVPDGQTGDGQASVIYVARTGEIKVDAPVDTELTSINIMSAAGIFTADASVNVGGRFDVDSDDTIFKATFGSSFGSLSFGNVAIPDLEEAFVLSDLTVVGSLAGGGGLGEVDLIYVAVPEPTTATLLTIGLLGLAAMSRRNPTRE